MEIKIDASKVPASMGGDESKTPEQIEQERIATEAADKKAADDAQGKAQDDGAGTDDGTGGSASDDNTEEVEIDGVVYTLDATGNAVAADGSVYMTAEEINALESPTDDNDIVSISNVKKYVNVVVKDDKGKEVEYEDTPEGIAKYTADVVQLRAKEIADNSVKEFFDNNPEIYQAYLYKDQNGTLEGFNANASWKDFDLSTATSDQLKNVIVNHRRQLGDDEIAIKYFVERLETEKQLETYGKNLIIKYVKEEEQTVTAAQAKIKADEDKRIEENTKYWNKVKSVVTSGKVDLGDKTITIPEVLRVKDQGTIKTYSRDDFFKYIYDVKPYQIGNEIKYFTQNQFELYQQQLAKNENHEIIEALTRFLKDDTSQVITRAINDANVKQVKKLSTKLKSGGHKTDSNMASKDVKIVIKRN